MDRESHWNRVYDTKPLDSVSWYQDYPTLSMEYIKKHASPSQRVIDIGAGASSLIDALLDAGYSNLVALDVSVSGLERIQLRLGPRAAKVQWVAADVTQSPELPAIDLWHDRATLHFLTGEPEQTAYVRLATRSVVAGGCLVIATFALDGPERCSGLSVKRHDGASLSRLFGDGFELLEQAPAIHRTPSGNEQRFCWAVFRRNRE